jgi:AraC-like DNA-binding protein
MPNRIIKDAIWTSDNLNKLSPHAERHFYRILLAADDWGCLEITPAIIKGKCYPLQQEITIEHVASWNKELTEHTILKHWEANNRVYAMFLTFDDHNETLEKHDPKTPCPPWLLRSDGIDPRQSDKTSEAFKRIGDAVRTLNNNGHKPSIGEIASHAHSSKSTVVRYFKRTKQLILPGTPGTVGGTDA